MISWHTVGQMVVCVDEEGQPGAKRPNSVARGDIYTIREVYMDPHHEEPFFRLQEVVNPEAQFKLGFFEPGFTCRRFRPVRPTSIEQFRYLLNPSSELVDELEEV